VTRELTVDAETEAQSPENRPIELYEVYLDQSTLYLTTHDQNVEFDDEVWIALGLQRSPIRTNVETRVDECTVSLDNVTRELSALIAQTEFVGRRMRIQKVFLDLLDDPMHAVVVFDGFMDEPVISQEVLRVTVRSRMDTLTVQTPRRTYRRLCNWKFGSPECGIDIASVTVSGTVDSVSQDGLTITDSDRNEAEGHFVDGVMTIDGESRLVVASDEGEITLEYPFTEDVTGKSYTLRRGCNKSYDESCVARFNNGANFGGFVSVPTREQEQSA